LENSAFVCKDERIDPDISKMITSFPFFMITLVVGIL